MSACEGIYVCEYCGELERNGIHDVVHVFGKLYYFCSDPCRDWWLSEHTRTFKLQSKVKPSRRSDGRAR